jgi:hypothetical protein
MCDDEMTLLPLPEYAVLLRHNGPSPEERGSLQIVAMFASLKDADAYLDGYAKLEPGQCLTVESRDKEDPRAGVIHMTLSCRGYEVVETSPGIFASVPEEMAPMYGDQWVSRD